MYFHEVSIILPFSPKAPSISIISNDVALISGTQQPTNADPDAANTSASALALYHRKYLHEQRDLLTSKIMYMFAGLGSI